MNRVRLKSFSTEMNPPDPSEAKTATPICDEAAFYSYSEDQEGNETSQRVVAAFVAEDLERENQSLREQVQLQQRYLDLYEATDRMVTDGTLRHNYKSLRKAAEAVADALEEQMSDVRWSISSAQVDEDSEQSLIYGADKRAKAALAALRAEMEAK